MKDNTMEILTLMALILFFGMILLTPALARAHCDTLDGPVVEDARAALSTGELTPVLKWVRAEDETEIRAAFDQALAVRKLGPEARQLADRHFFETLVRVHRAGEGAPYTGLKPAGQVEPAVAKADQALAQQDIEPFLDKILAHTAAGIRERFQRTVEAARHQDESVAAGRAYVAAYVDYVHYLEGVVQAVHREHAHAPAQGHAH